MTHAWLRDLGFTIGRMPTGTHNAITDVPDTLVPLPIVDCRILG